MSNLTEISIGVRKIGLFAVMGIIAFVLLRLAVGLGIAYYKMTHLPPPPPPDVAFGKLPKLKYADKFANSSGLTFTLQTVEGRPPEATDAARVFLMPKKAYTFESGEEAKLLAKKLGFESLPRIDTVYYYFVKENEPKLNLFIDGTNLNFQYKYNYAEDPLVFGLGHITDIDEANQNSTQFLKYSNLWDETILSGKTTNEVLIFDDRIKQLVEATSLSTAHAVKVHYFRPDIDKMSVLPDEFDKSYNYVIYASTPGKNLNNILEVSYIFWPIDLNTSGSYPLITGEEAYQALTDGNATVVLKGDNETNIVIRKIYLAYYDSSIPQSYLQPIFVFEGDNGFVAYYSAIKPELLQ